MHKDTSTKGGNLSMTFSEAPGRTIPCMPRVHACPVCFDAWTVAPICAECQVTAPQPPHPKRTLHRLANPNPWERERKTVETMRSEPPVLVASWESPLAVYDDGLV